jgi:hypothetical protein
VVPGGVFSRSELEVALATDPVVAAHYRDFDVANTYVTRVQQPRAVHVSYRLGERVYWTQRKVWLRPGEALLSDGVQLARGRCGNRVADINPGPVAPEDPPLELLDEPVPDPPPGIAPLRAFELMFVQVPDIDPQPMALAIDPLPSQPVTILPIPPPLIVEHVAPPPPILGEVPEPATLLMFGTGVSVLAARYRRRIVGSARSDRPENS